MLIANFDIICCQLYLVVLLKIFPHLDFSKKNLFDFSIFFQLFGKVSVFEINYFLIAQYREPIVVLQWLEHENICDLKFDLFYAKYFLTKHLDF